jgi:hypothetical protein
VRSRRFSGARVHAGADSLIRKPTFRDTDGGAGSSAEEPPRRRRCPWVVGCAGTPEEPHASRAEEPFVCGQRSSSAALPSRLRLSERRRGAAGLRAASPSRRPLSRLALRLFVSPPVGASRPLPPPPALRLPLSPPGGAPRAPPSRLARRRPGSMRGFAGPERASGTPSGRGGTPATMPLGAPTRGFASGCAASPAAVRVRGHRIPKKVSRGKKVSPG